MTVIAVLALIAAPVAAQNPIINGVPLTTCKVYDAAGTLIWTGPCEGNESYRDSCIAGEHVPPNCPRQPCSGGVAGDVQNGDNCIEGSTKSFAANGDILDERLICYCDVPAVSPVAAGLGFLLGLVFLRRRSW